MDKKPSDNRYPYSRNLVSLAIHSTQNRISQRTLYRQVGTPTDVRFLAFILWTEDWRARKTFTSMPRALALYIGPVAMSGLIELVQAYCTTNRSGDWLDLAANAIGALSGIVLGCFVTRTLRKKGHR